MSWQVSYIFACTVPTYPGGLVRPAALMPLGLLRGLLYYTIVRFLLGRIAELPAESLILLPVLLYGL